MIKLLKKIHSHLSNLIQMNWYFGWEWYEGKPKFCLHYTDYDCGGYCFHLGKFWVEVSWHDYKSKIIYKHVIPDPVKIKMISFECKITEKDSARHDKP